MSAISREISVLLAIKTINCICVLQQYDRLVSNKLFKHENVNEVYAKQMNRLIKSEEYEKCALLEKLFAKS